MKHYRLAAVLVLAAAFALNAMPHLLAQKTKQDPQVGTWKMTMSNGKPQSTNTLVFDPLPNGEKRRSYSNNAQGEKTGGNSYTAYYDGRDYPVTGNPDIDAVQIRRVDDWTSERINKKDGKEISRARRVISADGKTMTITTTRTDASGKTTTSSTVYDRQ